MKHERTGITNLDFVRWDGRSARGCLRCGEIWSLRDDACFIFSPVLRGTSTHARLATRASWARFSTSATVRIRFARARGLPSVGTRSARCSPETLYNFPRRRPPPPNRATDDRGRATLTPSPAPLSLTPQPPRFTWAPRLPSVWVLVSSRAPRGRYASTPRVTSASPLLPAPVRHARAERKISRGDGRARPSTASRRVEPRLTRPDHALLHAELALVHPQDRRGLLQEQLIPRRSIEDDDDADEVRVPLANVARARIDEGAETRHRAAPRRPALEITTFARVFHPHRARPRPSPARVDPRGRAKGKRDARLRLESNPIDASATTRAARRDVSFPPRAAPRPPLPPPLPRAPPETRARSSYSLKSFRISSGAARASVTGHVPLLRTCASTHA